MKVLDFQKAIVDKQIKEYQDDYARKLTHRIQLEQAWSGLPNELAILCEVQIAESGKTINDIIDLIVESGV